MLAEPIIAAESVKLLHGGPLGRYEGAEVPVGNQILSDVEVNAPPQPPMLGEGQQPLSAEGPHPPSGEGPESRSSVL